MNYWMVVRLLFACAGIICGSGYVNSQSAVTDQKCEGEVRTVRHVTLATPRGSAFGILCLDDGDSFSVGPTWVRLAHIDAPRLSRNCLVAGNDVPARCRLGLAALAELSELLASGAHCKAEQRDRFNRWVATCTTADGIDISAELVKRGYACNATAFDREGSLRDFETLARAAPRGLWKTPFGFTLTKACVANRRF